jgi:hypothetical protein
MYNPTVADLVEILLGLLRRLGSRCGVLWVLYRFSWKEFNYPLQIQAVAASLDVPVDLRTNGFLKKVERDGPHYEH